MDQRWQSFYTMLSHYLCTSINIDTYTIEKRANQSGIPGIIAGKNKMAKWTKDNIKRAKLYYDIIISKLTFLHIYLGKGCSIIIFNIEYHSFRQAAVFITLKELVRHVVKQK